MYIYGYIVFFSQAFGKVHKFIRIILCHLYVDLLAQ